MDNQYIVKLLACIKDVMAKNRDYLIKLDSVVGDGDLGLTMGDGFSAAYQAVENAEETDIGKILYTAGKAMSSAVPSTMGTLMASGLMNAGKVLKGVTKIDLSGIALLFSAYMEGVSARGKAKVGEKTFLDGIYPAVSSLENSQKNGAGMVQAAEDAYRAAKTGFEATKTMLAVHGRAATRGEASKTLEDPGAAVAVLIMEGLVLSLK